MNKILLSIAFLFIVGLIVFVNTSSYSIQFLDQATNKPISNERVEIQGIVICDKGDCPTDIRFEDKTNASGIIKVPKKIMGLEEFRIVISSGRFNNHGTRVDHKWIAPGEFDPNIVLVQQSNEGGTDSVEEEFDVTKDIVVVRLWFREN